MRKVICNQVDNCEFGKYCTCAKPFIYTGLKCKFRSDVTFVQTNDEDKPEVTDDDILNMWVDAGGTFTGIEITPEGELTHYSMTEKRIIKFIRGLL